MTQLPVSLNQEIEINIHSINHQGEGVGRYEGLAIFVAGTIPGEKVMAKVTELKKNFARAELLQVLETSQNRIDPLCKVYGQCGGCQKQHISYQAQQEIKTQLVKDALYRIGKIEDVLVQPIIAMAEPWHYRNKAHFQVAEKDGQTVLGFFAEESHQVVPVSECHLLDKYIIEITEIIEKLLNKHQIKAHNWETREGMLRHVVIRIGHFTGEMMVTFVTTSGEFDAGVLMAKELMHNSPYVVSVLRNINNKRSREVLGDEFLVLGGRMQVWERLGDLTFAVSPGAFFQVNSEQAKVLYDLVRQYANLKGNETVLDVYCGVGTIANYLARSAKKVIGIEAVPTAIIDAKRNSELNKIRNAQFLSGKAEYLLPKMYEKGIRPEVVVLDPPRRGADKGALSVLADMGPERIVYVSCDPASLARDLAYLAERGYKAVELQPVDMFPWTAHVECVVLIKKCGF